MRRGHVAIGLVSASIILYEVAITRVLSVLLWYHFAFLSISLALLGVALPGVWFSVFPPRTSALKVALLSHGLLLPLSLAALNYVGSSTAKPLWLMVALMLLPLLAGGSAIFLLLDEAKGRAIGPRYASDLIGAALGALLIVPLLSSIPTPLVIAGAGLLPLIALGVAVQRGALWAAGSSIAVALLLAWGKPFEIIQVSKGDRSQFELLLRRWTPTALISVFRAPNASAGFLWGTGTKFDRSTKDVRQLWIELDGSAGTPITQLDHPPSELPHLDFDVTSAAYQLRPPKKVCVIGAGGGRDILTALRSGAENVDAVELNPGVIDAVSKDFGELSGDIYHRPGVHAFASEGRSFLTRNDDRYDMIQLSLVDSWAATAAGAFALSENNLYTVEAYRLYWRRLSDRGIVTTSRWLDGPAQIQCVRLMLMAKNALELEGVEHPEQHIALVGASKVGTVLVSKPAFDASTIAKLGEIAEARGFDVIWPVPKSVADKPLSIPAQAMLSGPAFLEDWGLDIVPSTDDRPFFFQTLPLFGHIDPRARERLSFNEEAVVMLRWLIVGVSALSIVLFFLPLVLKRRIGSGRAFWRGSAYFLSIGLAFMLIEVPWIQRFILYLGHPSHATTVVLSALLLGAGIGSFLASKIEPARAKRLGLVLPLVLIAVTVLLGPLFEATLGLDLALRVMISIVLLAPAGLLMGIAFPIGMISFGDAHKPWFWAMNGAASVLASVLSVGLSMSLGFSTVLCFGVLFYVAAWIFLDPRASSP
jgi:hypothetical protein